MYSFRYEAQISAGEDRNTEGGEVTQGCEGTGLLLILPSTMPLCVQAMPVINRPNALDLDSGAVKPQQSGTLSLPVLE